MADPSLYSNPYVGRLAAQVGGSAQGQLRGILSQGQELLNPWGSPRMRAMLLRAAMMRAQAQRGRQSRISDLYGVDPYAARGNAVNADTAATGGVADALNNAQYSDMAANRDYLRSLFGGQLDYERQRQLAKDQAKAQSSGGIGGALGSLAGMAASFIPGVGPVLGGAMGAAGRASRGYGSNDPNSQYFMGPQYP